MDILLKKTTFLSIPVVEHYYNLQEILPYYYSLKSMKDKRDFYPILLSKTNMFFDVNKIENNIELLDKYIFSFDREIFQEQINFSNDEIIELSPNGFKLLNLTIPFDSDDLKRAYKTSAKIHHPDIGGDEENMKVINGAFITYQEFLTSQNYSISEDDKEYFYEEILNAESFYRALFQEVINIYLDIWELEKAKELITYFLDSILFSCDAYFLREQLNVLSKKLTVINEYENAQIFFDKKLSFDKQCDDNDFTYENEVTKNILSKNKNMRVTITHVIQAENAYKLHIISEKKYKEYIKKFSTSDSKLEQLTQELIEYFKENSFAKLPYDNEINFSTIGKYISRVEMFESKNIYDLTEEQQNEYYSTFYINPSIPLIEKYLYIRIASTIFSLENYEVSIKFIPNIIKEYQLFYHIYDVGYPTFKSPKELIKKLINDLNELLSLDESNYLDTYTEIKKEYLEYLPMFNSEKAKVSYTF